MANIHKRATFGTICAKLAPATKKVFWALWYILYLSTESAQYSSSCITDLKFKFLVYTLLLCIQQPDSLSNCLPPVLQFLPGIIYRLILRGIAHMKDTTIEWTVIKLTFGNPEIRVIRITYIHVVEYFHWVFNIQHFTTILCKTDGTLCDIKPLPTP